ncbi:MAG: DNA-directed RNA polymerase subunit L [Candidatus Heimdallarchaeota archaeon]|nr:DNA-directed RNA polymerase subunit L [Candidatus Heimdallarchaeota archaeon]
MQTKIVRREEAILEFEIIGENHTFLNMLRETLKDQEGVLFAAYRSPHPLLENPIFHIRTSGIDPVDALHAAADAAIMKCSDLLAIFEKKIPENI